MRDQASRLRQLVSGTNSDASPAACPTKSASGGRSRVIAVTSGKGGVGKTMVAVNLALLFAEMRSKVLIVDADLGLANVDVMLGMDPGQHIGRLLSPDGRADEVAADGPCGVKVISGGSGLRELADAASVERLTLLSKLRSYYGEFDYVLVDTSPGIGSDVTDFLTTADDILLVTTGEPTALRDTYAAIKTIAQTIPGADVTPVVNRAGSKQASQAMDALNQVARRFLDREFTRWHFIEDDLMVGRAIAERRPIVRSYPRSPASVCLRRLANELTRPKRTQQGRDENRPVGYAVACA